MNDKDKEAFEKWFEDFWGEEYDSYRGNHKFQEIAYQAACEYKQKEIDLIKQIMRSEAMLNTSLSRDNKKLQAENAKLRECVEWYASRKEWGESHNAKQCLRELGINKVSNSKG